MGRVRWSVSTEETVRLRFDDQEFLDWQADEEHELDYDDYIADGTYMQVRRMITGKEKDRIESASIDKDARQGLRPDPETFNALLFSTWVVGIGNEDETAPQLSRSRHKRGEQFAEFPADVRDALIRRLMVYVDNALKPAKRDPKQTDSGVLELQAESTD